MIEKMMRNLETLRPGIFAFKFEKKILAYRKLEKQIEVLHQEKKDLESLIPHKKTLEMLMPLQIQRDEMNCEFTMILPSGKIITIKDVELVKS